MKYLTIFLALIMLCSVASAADFDNVKAYDSKLRQATITNNFGLGTEIAKVRLISQPVEYVVAGKDVKVAEFEIDLSVDSYNDFLKSMKLYDLNKGLKPINRPVTYKQKVVSYVESPVYTLVCKGTGDFYVNGTEIESCRHESSGTELKAVETWIPLGKMELTKGKVVIGVFTDVLKRDRVEWIPELFGVEINEWAQWTAGLYDSLYYYHNFTGNRSIVSVQSNLSTLMYLSGTYPEFQTFSAVNFTALNVSTNKHAQINASITNPILNFKTPDVTMNVWALMRSVLSSDDSVLGTRSGGNGWNLEYVTASNGWIFNGGCAASYVGGVVTMNKFYMHTIIVNKTGIKHYINGTLITQCNLVGTETFNKSTVALSIGSRGDSTLYWNGVVDELSFWNRSLSAAEITQLYKSGVGITFDAPTYANLIYPVNDSSILEPIVYFNTTGEIPFVEFVNATLTLYDSGDNVVNTSTRTVSGSYNETSFPQAMNTFGGYSYTVQYCTLSSCINSGQRNYFTWGYLVNSNTYNQSTFETAKESYSINITPSSGISLSSGNFYYNNQKFPATLSAYGSNEILTISQDVPLGVGSRSFIWELIFNSGSTINITSSQYVNNTNLTLCSPAINKPFLNISFKNETISQQAVTAYVSESSLTYWLGDGSVTKNLTFSNATENNAYAFCVYPPHKTINTLIDYFRYANSYSEQRTYSPAQMSLSNVTTNVTLFLLPSVSGQFVTFQVINNFNQPVSDVAIQISRAGFGGITTTSTSASGTATIFLDPNFQYSLTASKVGYSDYTTTQTFSLTEYTITLGGGLTTFGDYTQGVSAMVQPAPFKVLRNDTNIQFNLTIFSSVYPLESYGFTIRNESGSYINGTYDDSDSDGGKVSVWINTAHHQSLTMEYFWVVNGSYQNVSVYSWTVSELGTGSVKGFFTRLRMYTLDGDGLFGMDKFAYTVIISFLIVLLVGSLAYKVGIFQGADIFVAILAVSMILISFLGVFSVQQSIIMGTLAGLYLLGLIIWRIRQ